MTEENEDKLKCEDCGKLGAHRTICPYAEEIGGEQVDITVCDNCYHQRAMDI